MRNDRKVDESKRILESCNQFLWQDNWITMIEVEIDTILRQVFSLNI